MNKTIENIACYTHDVVVPLVLWTGNGYHVYVVLNMAGPLEHIEEYATAVGSLKEISREFMLFAKAFLSNNRADSKNNPSFESCLLRIPYSLNSKCLSNGGEQLDPEVKVIQNWNGHAATMNEITLLLSGFYTHLVGKKVVVVDNVSKTTTNLKSKKFAGLTNSIRWIEILLQNGLTEHRKYVISLILVPYFINIKSLSDENAAAKIKEWLSKCANNRPLDTTYNFDYWIKYYIHRCKANKNLKPIRFEDRLPESNPDLYKIIKSEI